jgi:hypothetical protein
VQDGNIEVAIGPRLVFEQGVASAAVDPELDACLARQTMELNDLLGPRSFF